MPYNRKLDIKKESPLISLCHPYIFALKEGKKIEEDLFDYSLLLLHRTCTEVVKAPVPKFLSK